MMNGRQGGQEHTVIVKGSSLRPEAGRRKWIVVGRQRCERMDGRVSVEVERKVMRGRKGD